MPILPAGTGPSPGCVSMAQRGNRSIVIFWKWKNRHSGRWQRNASVSLRSVPGLSIPMDMYRLTEVITRYRTCLSARMSERNGMTDWSEYMPVGNVWLSIPKRSNAIAVKEDFYRAAGHPDIDLLLDILIGAGVVLCIHADVVVVLNCGNSPCGQLERMSGQRKQKELLFLKRGSSAPVFLLKGLMIEPIEPVPYSFVQLAKRKKLLVPQGCEYKCRNNPHRAFHGGLILRGSRTGRNDGRAVVLGHFPVGTVDDQFIPCVFRYAGFEV